MEFITKNVSRNLKRIRKSREMSLDDVAKQTGISKSMLGQIERGVSFNSLISSTKNDIIIVNKADLEPSYISKDEDYKAYEYFPYEEDRTFEIYMMNLEGGSKYESDGHGDNTYEYLTVISGIVTIIVDGKSYTVTEENSIRFPTSSKHTYMNPTEFMAKFCVTLTWN